MAKKRKPKYDEYANTPKEEQLTFRKLRRDKDGRVCGVGSSVHCTKEQAIPLIKDKLIKRIDYPIGDLGDWADEAVEGVEKADEVEVKDDG